MLGKGFLKIYFIAAILFIKLTTADAIECRRLGEGRLVV